MSDTTPSEPQQTPTPPPEPNTSKVAPTRQRLHVPRQLLYALFKLSDHTLTRLTRLLSTPGGVDTTLCTLCYTLTLLHTYLSSRLQASLAQLAASIAEKASAALLPGETLIASLPAPAQQARLATATSSIKSLVSLISDFRIFVRLWGLLGIYSWAKGTYLSPPRDKVILGIVWAQVFVNTALQVLENGAYLASHGILNTARWTGEEGARRQARWWAWSSRFWAAHVGLEFSRLGYMWINRSLEKRDIEKNIAVDGAEGAEKALEVKREEWRKEDEAWRRDVVVNAAYAPMTLHWSIEEGLLSESWIGFLGMVAGGTGLKELWNRTALGE